MSQGGPNGLPYDALQADRRKDCQLKGVSPSTQTILKVRKPLSVHQGHSTPRSVPLPSPPPTTRKSTASRSQKDPKVSTKPSTQRQCQRQSQVEPCLDKESSLSLGDEFEGLVILLYLSFNL